jgi:hypothetical protein
MLPWVYAPGNDCKDKIELVEPVVIAPAVPLIVVSPTLKGMSLAPPSCRMVMLPPAVPPNVEMLAVKPLVEVKVSVARKKRPVVMSTSPP